MRFLNKTIGYFSIAILCLVVTTAQAVRLGDITDFQGVRSNPLIGFGLVVGLNNSGDQTTQTPFTGQALENMLTKLGLSVPAGTNMQLKNVASVMVTADLPAFASPGQTIDVTVSSVGNAKSLKGGTLLMTPLKGADGQTYVLAQGNLVIPGAGASAGGSSVQINTTTAGRVPSGGIVEREISAEIASHGTIRLELKNPSFSTARNVTQAINDAFGKNIAEAKNSRTIVLDTPTASTNKIAFIAQVQNLDVSQGPVQPKVVINSRTGSVVLNKNVTLDHAAIAHGNLSVTIDSNPVISQPNALSGGNTVVENNAEINVQEESGAIQTVKTSASLDDVVAALNKLGATPSDLMAILEALKEAGSLHADLKII